MERLKAENEKLNNELLLLKNEDTRLRRGFLEQKSKTATTILPNMGLFCFEHTRKPRYLSAPLPASPCCPPVTRIIEKRMTTIPATDIDLHINNCTALSVKILDNVPQCTPYSNFSL
jgi:hypothetical protein